MVGDNVIVGVAGVPLPWSDARLEMQIPKLGVGRAAGTWSAGAGIGQRSLQASSHRLQSQSSSAPLDSIVRKR